MPANEYVVGVNEFTIVPVTRGKSIDEGTTPMSPSKSVICVNVAFKYGSVGYILLPNHKFVNAGNVPAFIVSNWVSVASNTPLVVSIYTLNAIAVKDLKIIHTTYVFGAVVNVDP